MPQIERLFLCEPLLTDRHGFVLPPFFYTLTPVFWTNIQKGMESEALAKCLNLISLEGEGVFCKNLICENCF